MDNKTCENCYYFCRHYYFHGDRFTYASCGHCINSDVYFSARRKKDFIACAKWAPMEKQKEENREEFMQTLQNVARKLDDILFVLDSDFFTENFSPKK